MFPLSTIHYPLPTIHPSFHIVGVLNTTPDSYFDGGQYDRIDAAVERAGQMLAEGADIIEVGGQSTGPGSSDVSVDEELTRTIPTIEAISAAYPAARISIDTFQSRIAAAAIDAGASMVNDVTAGRGDAAMFATLAKHDVPLVLMYSKDPTARTTIEERAYEDVIETISSFLMERIAEAQAQGIDRRRIIIDPGMGHFISSDPRYSFEVIARLKELTALGPVFVSPSRKSFLAGPRNLPAADRLPATIVVSAIAVQQGASYIRTHDVASVRCGCEIAVEF